MDVEFPNFNDIEGCSDKDTKRSAEMAAFRASENYSGEAYRINDNTAFDNRSLANSEGDPGVTGNGRTSNFQDENEAQVVKEASYESIQDSVEEPFIDARESFEVVKETPSIDMVRIVSNELVSKDIYSDSMTLREKMNWLEKRLQELKNIIDGNEVWMLSKEGHAMKVKCVLKTNELPECKGTGKANAVKFLRQTRETLISAGVTQNDWVTLAASRLKGDLKAAWVEEYNNAETNNWAKFSDFLLSYSKKKPGRISTDNKRMMKKRRISCEDILLKKLKEFE